MVEITKQGVKRDEVILDTSGKETGLNEQISTIIGFLQDQGYDVTKRGEGTDVYPKAVYQDGTPLLSIMFRKGEIDPHNRYTDIESALKGANTYLNTLNEEIKEENEKRVTKKQSPLPLFSFLKELQIVDLRTERN